jgi:hypothetical protein
LHKSGEETAGPSTAIGAKYAPISAQDDSLFFDANFRDRRLDCLFKSAVF